MCFAANNILLNNNNLLKLRSCVKMVDRFPKQAESDLKHLVDQKNSDRMIKQVLNSTIAKY